MADSFLYPLKPLNEILEIEKDVAKIGGNGNSLSMYLQALSGYINEQCGQKFSIICILGCVWGGRRVVSDLTGTVFSTVLLVET